MSSRKSTILDVPWTEQLAILGVAARGRALPALVTCPLCQGDRLSVHKSPGGLGGPHSRCAGCGFAGTLLELSARVWGVSPAEAAAKSTDLGVPLLPFAHTDEDLDAVTGSLAVLQRMRGLWQSAQANVAAEHLGGVRRILVEARAQPTAAAGRRYFTVAGAQFGVIESQEAERAFMPESVRQRGGGRAYNPSSARLFAGRGWRDVLVLPRQDSPGRLCAFEFVGRHGGTADRVMAVTETGATDLGLFGLDALTADTPFGRTVLAVDDALLALRLQARHAVSASVPLPVVAWADRGARRTQGSWQVLAGRKVVFWSREPSARLVRQALLAGDAAHITDAWPRRDDAGALDHFIRLPGDAAALLRRLERTALPALAFLSRWVANAPAGKLEAFVRGLIRNDVDPVPLANQLSAPARRCILDMRPHELRVAPRTAAVGRFDVVETRGGWYAYGGRQKRESRLLCSVIVRLLALRDRVYDALLIAGDREQLVQLPAGRHFERTVHDLCAEHGLDATFNRVVGLDLREVALAFSTPTTQQPTSERQGL